MDKEMLKAEIEHKKLMLHFTKRIILSPPTDEVSKAMLAQAERIQAQLDDLFRQLGRSAKSKKTKKKQVVKKSKPAQKAKKRNK